MTKRSKKPRKHPLFKRYNNDRLTRWAIRAKQAFRKGKKKEYERYIARLTGGMSMKFGRLIAKANKGQLFSPFDPKYHMIATVTKMGFADYLEKEGGCLEIMRDALETYRPSRGIFVPYADKAIFYYYLKAFEDYLIREDSRCMHLDSGWASKSKYFKQRHYISESAVQRKLADAFSLLPPKRGQVCVLRYLELHITAAIARQLKISMSTVRVAKKKALETLREKAPEVYKICKKFDKL